MTTPAPALASDWSYQLAAAFLAAATSCGATCSRVFVADSARVESPPPAATCTCQLAAIVSEGWLRVPGGGACAPQRVAEVRLVLDLCTLVADKDKVPTPVKVNTHAQENATTRWLIMEGLRKAWRMGDLSNVGEPSVGSLAQAMCARITPDRWRPTSSGGGSGRWETIWQFTDHE